MTRSLRDGPAPDVDELYEQRKRDLENAWRTPSNTAPLPAHVGAGPSGFVNAAGHADPKARARAIEREGENWKGGA
jgi:hypothetical protein